MLIVMLSTGAAYAGPLGVTSNAAVTTALTSRARYRVRRRIDVSLARVVARAGRASNRKDFGRPRSDWRCAGTKGNSGRNPFRQASEDIDGLSIVDVRPVGTTRYCAANWPMV